MSCWPYCNGGDSRMANLSALITLLAVIVYFLTGFQVARARARYGVKAPATTGNADFERVFRTQMNMLEWMPIFLPALWLAALYVSDAGAAIVGLVWVGGRIVYIRDYAQAAERRHLGFVVQAGAAGVLWVTALIGILKALAHG